MLRRYPLCFVVDDLLREMVIMTAKESAGDEVMNLIKHHAYQQHRIPDKRSIDSARG